MRAIQVGACKREHTDEIVRELYETFPGQACRHVIFVVPEDDREGYDEIWRMEFGEETTIN